MEFKNFGLALAFTCGLASAAWAEDTPPLGADAYGFPDTTTTTVMSCGADNAVVELRYRNSAGGAVSLLGLSANGVTADLGVYPKINRAVADLKGPPLISAQCADPNTIRISIYARDDDKNADGHLAIVGFVFHIVGGFINDRPYELSL